MGRKNFERHIVCFYDDTNVQSIKLVIFFEKFTKGDMRSISERRKTWIPAEPNKRYSKLPGPKKRSIDRSSIEARSPIL